MAILARQNLVEAGVNGTLSAATVTVGDSADNTDGKLIWVIRNGSGGSINAQVAVINQPSAVDPVLGVLTKAAISLAIPNGGVGIVGPLPPAVFNDANNRVTLICSVVTTVTVTPVKLP